MLLGHLRHSVGLAVGSFAKLLYHNITGLGK